MTRSPYARRRSVAPLWSDGAGRLARFVLLALLSLALWPAAPAGADGPRVYVGLFRDDAVAVLDVATGAALGTIPVPKGPHGMAVTPDGRMVYVSSDGATTVSAIDTAAGRVAATVEVGQGPHGIALTPDGALLLVTVWDEDRLALVDTGTNRVTGSIPLVRPHNVAVTPDGKTAYVASQAAGAPALAIVDLSRRMQTGSVPLERTPRGVSVSPDGVWLHFTVAGADAVYALDVATNEVVGQLPVGASPHIAVFTPAGDRSLVVSQGPGLLEDIDPAVAAVRGTTPVGQRPHWLATSSDGRLAFVTNEDSNSLSVVDIAGRTVLASLPVGNAPRKVVVQPGVTTEVATPAPSPTTGPGSAALPAQTGQAVQEVQIGGFTYSPSPLTVAVGQPVSWTNTDAVPHTVTGGPLDSGRLGRAGRYTFTFDAPGAYPYTCALHSYMAGLVAVEG